LPTIACLALLFSGMVYRYFSEQEEKKIVRGAFSRYVSSAVVEEILKDQSKLQLGGQKRELSVMFCDLAGFTKLSEHMDATFLTQLLNEYFTRMTRIILRNQGTLDKYMGDAIMCFWGAPLEFADHARLACRTALEMCAELDAINREWKLKHGISIGMRIGLNTGTMAVGNMGSEQVFSYTVMGDNANLGSRLEGVNNIYGTRVIVSEHTAVKSGGEFLFRPLDVVVVKGREDPVSILELVAGKEREAEHAEWLQAFAQALDAYRDRRWDDAVTAFRACDQLRGGDQPSRVFIERIEEFRNSQLADWDGIWKIGSK
jgi:adenylate cyclase